MTAITSRRIHLEAPGGHEALRADTELVPTPGPGEIRLRHTAIGVNFVDIYHRSGLYALPSLPATLGVEAAGVVESVGPGVTGLARGQRVAYAGLPVGSYAQFRLLAADRAVPLPDAISDELAAGTLLRGITAHMLLEEVWRLQPGETVLVHAAAGGLGLVLVQWAKALGARVIGTVSRADKAALAMRRGLDRAVCYRDEDFVAACLDFTAGAGVHLAIDGIGGETLPRTLEAVRPFGMVASVGQVRGESRAIALSELGPVRSIALARPSVFRFMSDLLRYRRSVAATQARWAAGLAADVGDLLPLEDAAEAHRRLEAGETSGALLLIP